MIYDTLAHAAQYKGLHAGLDKALDFLTATDLTSLTDGRYEIDGDAVFANVASYVTRAENPTPENHAKYMDVFCLLEGEELVAVAPLEEMGREVMANPEGDIWLHEGSGTLIPLGTDRFLVLLPSDAHAPSIGPNGPAPARKVVVKVKV